MSVPHTQLGGGAIKLTWLKICMMRNAVHIRQSNRLHCIITTPFVLCQTLIMSMSQQRTPLLSSESSHSGGGAPRAMRTASPSFIRSSAQQNGPAPSSLTFAFGAITPSRSPFL